MSQTRIETICLYLQSPWAQAQAAVTGDKYLSMASLLGLAVNNKAKAMSAHGKQENDLSMLCLWNYKQELKV